MVLLFVLLLLFGGWEGVAEGNRDQIPNGSCGFCTTKGYLVEMRKGDTVLGLLLGKNKNLMSLSADGKGAFPSLLIVWTVHSDPGENAF